MERGRAQQLDKVGRNVSVIALVVMVAVLPFEQGVDATYNAAQAFVLVGFLIRMIGRQGWRYWATAVGAFFGSVGVFAILAAINPHRAYLEYTVLEILKEFLLRIGALYFCMILVFLSQFVYRPEEWGRHDRWTNLILAVAWAFGLIVIVSAIHSHNPAASLRYVYYYLAPYLLAYTIVVETLYSWRHYRILITTIYLVGIIVTTASVTARYLYIHGGYDLKSSFLQHEIVRDQEEFGDHQIRVQWPFEHHNRLCSYALIVMLFVWLQFLITRDWQLKTLVAISAVIPFLCMVGTLTRGGWVALACGVIVLIAALNWRYIWIPVAIVVATWFVSDRVVRDRLVSVVRDMFIEGGTFYQRRLIWARSIEIIKKNPVLGLGAGWDVFQAHFNAEYPELRRNDEDIPHAHNNFLEIGAESGLPALALFLAFMGALGTQILRSWPREKKERRRRFVVAGFLALFAAITVYGLSNYSLRYSVGMLIWICFALMTLLPSIVRAIHDAKEDKAAPGEPTAASE